MMSATSFKCHFSCPVGWPQFILLLPAVPQIGSMFFWEGTTKAVRVKDVQYQLGRDADPTYANDLKLVNIICEASRERVT